MRWEEQTPDVTFGTLENWDQEFTVLELCSLLAESKQAPFISLQKKIRQNVLDHLSSKKTELGGLLLGKVFRLTSNPLSRVALIEVSDSLKSEDFDSTGVSLTMDTEIWDRARTLIGDDAIIVGWYHSHPDLGAFFSGTDRHTQASVFYHDYSLGLVVDPIRKEEKWFVGPSSNEVPAKQIRNF